MTGYINPTVIIPSILAGIDFEIFKLQNLLIDSMVIEKIFGQAFLQLEQKNKEEIRAPYCYLKNNEPINVMPNDNIISQSFFYVHDPEEVSDEGSLVKSFVSVANVSLILWGNLNHIEGNSVETIKIKVLDRLKDSPNVRIQRVYKSFEEVFSRFTITDGMKNYNKLPFFGIRIDFNLNFVLNAENC